MKNSGVRKARKQEENLDTRLALLLNHVKARRGCCLTYLSNEWRRKYTPLLSILLKCYLEILFLFFK